VKLEEILEFKKNGVRLPDKLASFECRLYRNPGSLNLLES